MICPDCRGRGWTPRMAAIDDGPMMGLCETCGGSGIAPPFEQRFTCPHCFAVSHHPTDIRERYCGRCHQFADDDDAA